MTILRRHAAQGEPLRLLEDWGEVGGERLWMPFPAWLVELANPFHGRHGEQGDVILQRVLNGLLPFDSLP